MNTLKQTKNPEELLPSGETHLEAAQRYYGEVHALEQDPSTPQVEVDAKRATAEYLAREGIRRGQAPAPTGEPNRDFAPPVDEELVKS